MKKSLIFLGIALVALASCGKENEKNDPSSDLPSAANIDFNVTVNEQTNEATFSLPSTVKGLMPIWHTNETGEFVFAGTGDNFKKTFYQKGTYKVRLFVSNSKGQSLDYSEKEVVIAADKGGKDLTGGFKYDSEFNLWKDVDVDGHHEYSQYTAVTSVWTQVDNPKVIQVGNTYSMTYDQATEQQWQAQFFIIPTEGHEITLAAGTTYDFSCVICSSTDLPGVTFKLTAGKSDENYLFIQRVAVKAGEPYVFWWPKQAIEEDIPNVKMVFDFGGCPAGSEITVGNIVLKDNANDDGTKDVPEREPEPEPEPVDPDAGYVDEYDKDFVFDLATPANLWAASKVEVSKTYYGGPNWEELEFNYDVKDGVYTLNYPTAAPDRWKAQFIFSSDLAIEADKQYAITFTVESNTDHPGMYLKFTGPDDEKNVVWETKPDVKVKAGEARVFHATGIQGVAYESSKLVFDFGGVAEGTIIKLKDISIQYYK